MAGPLSQANWPRVSPVFPRVASRPLALPENVATWLLRRLQLFFQQESSLNFKCNHFLYRSWLPSALHTVAVHRPPSAWLRTLRDFCYDCLARPLPAFGPARFLTNEPKLFKYARDIKHFVSYESAQRTAQCSMFNTKFKFKSEWPIAQHNGTPRPKMAKRPQLRADADADRCTPAAFPHKNQKEKKTTLIYVEQLFLAQFIKMSTESSVTF